MKSTKKAFTLVELIVVITILAILGTIAFISLGSYTGDARNAKRTDAISKIATSIENALIDGKSAISFVTGTASRLGDTELSIAGESGTDVDATEYTAGDTNYTALNIKGDDFRDPDSDVAYPLGATDGNKYEVAAKLEDDAGDAARVMGNWDGRTAAPVAGSRVSDSSFKITSGGDINKIRKWDQVTFITNPAGNEVTTTVVKVSRDGQTLTTTVDMDATSDNVILGASVTGNSESAGLIKETGTGTGVVVDGGSVFPY